MYVAAHVCRMTTHPGAQGVCFHSDSAKGLRITDRGGSVHFTRKSRLSLMAAVSVIALLAAACGSSSNKSNNASSSGGSGNTVNNGPVPQGGTLTLGAEQEPDCLDFIASCASSSWG